VSAVQLNWDGATWTPGTLNNSFDIDSSHAGNDVSFAITGNTSQFQQGLVSPNPLTPAITRAFDGGLSPGHNSLELALNLTSNAQTVTITIDFSSLYLAGVSNVSFQIFDIDFDNITGSTYQDTISSITALSTTGVPLAPTITGLGSNVSLSGIGLSQILTGNISTVDIGPGSAGGNASISFDTANIRSVSFTYGSGAAFANPTNQHIGIYNLDFVVVPEPSSLAYCVIGCAVMAGLLLRRRRARADS
jgi:hypothetical protein